MLDSVRTPVGVACLWFWGLVNARRGSEGRKSTCEVSVELVSAPWDFLVDKQRDAHFGFAV